MNTLTTGIVEMALLGAALVGGVFFAFSSFVMKALGRLPESEGITAMQSINLVVINPTFLGTFLGTALLSLVTGGLAVAHWDHPSAPFHLSGAFAYFVGTFLVTVRANVPLNDQLAKLTVSDAPASERWSHYQKQWMKWNHVRTLAALVAALLYAVALLRQGVS